MTPCKWLLHRLPFSGRGLGWPSKLLTPSLLPAVMDSLCVLTEPATGYVSGSCQDFPRVEKSCRFFDTCLSVLDGLGRSATISVVCHFFTVLAVDFCDQHEVSLEAGHSVSVRQCTAQHYMNSCKKLATLPHATHTQHPSSMKLTVLCRVWGSLHCQSRGCSLHSSTCSRRTCWTLRSFLSGSTKTLAMGRFQPASSCLGASTLQDTLETCTTTQSSVQSGLPATFLDNCSYSDVWTLILYFPTSRT